MSRAKRFVRAVGDDRDDRDDRDDGDGGDDGNDGDNADDDGDADDGNDEDMAGVAIYLAARSGNYVVGETIAVDGGIVHAYLTDAWEVDPSGH